MTEEYADAVDQLWTVLANERAQVDAGCTKDEVEQEAT